MMTSLVANVKGYLLDPVGTFSSSKDDDIRLVLSYYTVMVAIHAVLATALVLLRIGDMPVYAGLAETSGFPFVIFFFMLAAGFLLPLLFGLWLHAWVWVFGGRKGIIQTLKIVVYGGTPQYLFGWIPLMGFLFLLWSLALGILGIRELQEMDALKAILVVALAVMVPVILLMILALYFFTTLITTGSVLHPTTNSI